MLRVVRILAVLALITMSLLAGPSQGAPAQDAKSSVDQGHEFMKKGQYDQAIASFSQAIKADSKNAVYYNARGLAYFNANALDKTIADYSKAIQLNPKYAVAHNNRGLAYYTKGVQNKAMADYNKAIELDPKYAIAYANRGLAYYPALFMNFLKSALTILFQYTIRFC